MKRPFWFLLFAASTGLAIAQQSPKPALLALSKQDHTLAIVDPSDLHVVARIPVGDDPHEVTASANGRIAYVSNYGFGAFHTLTVIDLVGQRSLGVIDLGALRGPHGLAFAAGKVWFTAEAAKAIESYDPSTHSIDWIMGTGQNRTHMLYVFPDGKRIVTTNVNSGTVSIIEKSEVHADALPNSLTPPPHCEDWLLTVVSVGRGSEGFDLSPGGKEAWVANAGDETISIVDIAEKKVTATLPANAPGANRLKFTPDGRRVLVSAGSYLVVLDAATRKEIKRMSVGHGLGGIQIQPDGARAYVASGLDGFVTVIDLNALEVVARIDVGKGPDGLAWAARQ
ncbi:MAG: YncE family protein [Terracidiphilus sp.]|jgi:YVTN family beta-propeller protein